MKKVFIGIFLFCTTMYYSNAQPGFVKELSKGKPQTLIVYGTSITKMGNGQLWVNEVGKAINKKYNNKLNLYNSGASGQYSVWGLKNLQDSVLKRVPDAVIIEFAVNDAVDRFMLTPAQAKANTNEIIDKILEVNPKADVILMLVAEHPLGEAAKKRPDLASFNNNYREIAKERGLLLIDIASTFREVVDKSGVTELKKYQGDGVHLTSRGALDIVLPGVLKALKIE